jgi:hypothetical protein
MMDFTPKGFQPIPLTEKECRVNELPWSLKERSPVIYMTDIGQIGEIDLPQNHESNRQGTVDAMASSPPLGLGSQIFMLNQETNLSLNWWETFSREWS